MLEKPSAKAAEEASAKARAVANFNFLFIIKSSKFD
jgi:hypothetical protein